MLTHSRFPLMMAVAAAFLAGTPAVAHAHVGVGSSDGFAHPLSGLDHLCVMIGVGLWAAQCGGRALWVIPSAFLLVMSIGGLLGMSGWHLPFVESGIIASMLILGLLLVAAIRFPLVASACLGGLFALFHGHAHGTEMPSAAAGLAYGLGFLSATALLHACGIGLGLMTRRADADWLARYAGVAMIVGAVYLGVR